MLPNMEFQSTSGLIKLLRSCIVAGVLALLVAGMGLFEAPEGGVWLGAACITFGAVASWLLPASWNLSEIALTGRVGISISLVSALGAQLWLFSNRGEAGVILISESTALLLWGLAVALIVFAAFVQDCRRNKAPCFTRGDWIIAACFFVLALGARLVGHTTLAVDEFGVFIEAMQNYPKPAGPPWCILPSGFPCLIDGVMFSIVVALRSAFDPLTSAKFLVLIASSLSVGAWFLVVRVFASRLLASLAATLLLFWGFHWVNSRFLYLYPYDMASLTIGTLCVVLSFERKKIVPVVLAGVVLAFALTARRIGLLMLPLYAYICLDYFWSAQATARKEIFKVSLAILVSAAFAYAPMFFEELSLGRHDRISEALVSRDKKLAEFGMSRAEAVFTIAGDVFRQLFVQAYDVPRHLIRPTGGLLDPVFSVIFVVGIVGAIKRISRDRSARIQIVGSLFCMAAMVLTFPLDSLAPRGLARRMVCASFFIAWIGASGALVVASRLSKAARTPVFAIGVCLTSLLTNLYYLKVYYLRPNLEAWHYDLGISRYELFQFSRTAAAKDINVLVLDHPFVNSRLSHPDLPRISEVSTAEEVRARLIDSQGASFIVIVPSSLVAKVPNGFYSELSDIIPIQFWVDGPHDAHGVPQFRYAALER